MSFSSFKSTSKRGTTPASSSKQDRIPNRRSKSVTPLSRTNGSPPKSSNLSVSDEFLNKRDNPLYCCSSSSSSSSPPGVKTHGRRGRSVSKNSGVGSQNLGNEKLARSSSRIDDGRRRIRSVSRERNGSSETDTEHQYKSNSSWSSKDLGKSVAPKGQKKSTVSADNFGAMEQTKKLQTWTSRHPISKSRDASSSSSQARNWEDGTSTTFSEAEVATTLVRDNLSVDVGSDAVYETVRSEVRRAVSEIRDDLENARAIYTYSMEDYEGLAFIFQLLFVSFLDFTPLYIASLSIPYESLMNKSLAYDKDEGNFTTNVSGPFCWISGIHCFFFAFFHLMWHCKFCVRYRCPVVKLL